MFHNIMSLVTDELSGARCFEILRKVSEYHRIQVSRELMEAARFCRQRWAADGLDTEVLTYPADGETAYWSSIIPLGWDPTRAELWIAEPAEHRQKLADFHDSKVCLFERSGATPPEGVRSSLVVLDNAEDPRSYENVDVRGKIVLTGQADTARIWSLAVKQHGAIGIVTDHMVEYPAVRERLDLPDALQRSRFRETPGDPGCFGFVLSPRTGRRLRQLQQKLEASGEQQILLDAKVDTTFSVGEMPNVCAVIPGETDEEVIITAHLCHPAGMAADNASGVGTVMEAARTLNALVTSGKLPTPKRSIRFLLVPEMTGTYAYLATNEERIGKFVAGLNLDMVGQNQAVCKGPVLIEAPTRATGTFVMELLERMLVSAGQKGSNTSGTASYPLFSHQVTPFSGGSDHYILSDPSVGIPVPMIIQWPDKFYHTTADTLDKMDIRMLESIGVMTATYAYFMANAGFEEAAWIAHEMSGKSKSTIAQICRDYVSEALEPRDKSGNWSPKPLKDICAFHVERRRNDYSALARLVTADNAECIARITDNLLKQIETFCESELQSASAALKAVLGTESARLCEHPFGDVDESFVEESKSVVPVRVFKGPIDASTLNARLAALPESWQEEYRRLPATRRTSTPSHKTMFTHIVYWTDGTRSVWDIASRVGLETGVFDLPFVASYIKFLLKAGLLTMRGGE